MIATVFQSGSVISRCASHLVSPLLLLLSMALLLGAGCGDEQGSECSINSDCPAGEVCSGGECIVECREQRDCPSGFICNGGRCEQAFGGNCSDDTDCRNGEFCIMGVCQPSDAVDDQLEDVAEDQQQDSGEDMPPDTSPDMTPDTPPDMEPDMPPDMEPDTPPDMEPDTPPDMEPDMTMDLDPDMGADMSCPPMNGQYLDPCACAAQCTTGLCLGDVAAGQGFCTQTCSTRSQCRSGQDACISAGMGQSVCAPDDTGNSCFVGGAASPSACLLQTCVNAAGDQASPDAFCALPCSTASDCKPAHSCAPVRCRDIGMNELECIMTIVPAVSANKEQLLNTYPIQNSVCVPIAQPNACIANGDEAACLSAICCGPGGGCSGSFCTGQCLDATDCPAGQCIALDQSDPRIPIGACVF